MFVVTLLKKPKSFPYWQFQFLEDDEKEVLDAKGNDPLVVTTTITSFQENKVVMDM